MRLVYTTWKLVTFVVQKSTMIVKEYKQSVTEYGIKVLLFVRNVISFKVQPVLEHC
jgi:hypothetical protein